MDHLIIVKTPEEHEAALERLMALMDADPEEGSREAEEQRSRSLYRLGFQGE